MNNADNLNDDRSPVPGENGHDEQDKIQATVAEPINVTAAPKAADAALPPVLQTWKTSPLFTVLGLIGCAFLSYIYVAVVQIFYLIIAGGEQSIIPIYMTAILGHAISAIYLLAIFPSYLTDTPILRSNKAISFMNCAFGGGILGLLWNHNLTKRWGKKSVSHLIFGGLSLLCIVVLLVGIAFFSVRPWVASGSSQSSGSVAQQVQQEYYFSQETGAAFELPLGWDRWDDPEEGIILTVAPSDSGAYADDGLLAVWADYWIEDYSDASMFSEESFKDWFAERHFDECVSVDSKSGQQQDVSYWVVRGNGYIAEEPVAIELVILDHDGRQDIFVYYDYTDSSEYSQYHDDFEDMIASVSYE